MAGSVLQTDVSIRTELLRLMLELRRERGLTYLFITHDLALAWVIADRIAVMYLGKLVETAGKRSLFARPRHPYTQALLGAVPQPHPRAERGQAVLAGDVPSPLAPPPGCRFHTRCPYAQDRCRIEEPRLRPAADGTGPDGTGADGHEVACHFFETIPETAAPALHRTVSPRLARRLALFDAA